MSMCATKDDILFTLTSDTKIMTFHRNFLEVTTMHNWQKTRSVGCCSTASVALVEPSPEDRLRESRVIPRFEFAGAKLTREENKDMIMNASASEKLRKMWTLRLLTSPIKDQSFDATSTMASAPQACQMLTPCILPVIICCQKVQRDNFAGETMDETVIQTDTKPDMEMVHKWLYSAMSDTTHDVVHVYAHLLKAGLVSQVAPVVDLMARN